jgi:hypothetical protein
MAVDEQTPKNKGGRPTKYTNDTNTQLLDYIENYEMYDDIIPSAAGFACVIGVDRSTLYAWAEKHKRFSNILGQLNAAQERIAIKKGLVNEWNATIVKLLLGKHGYHDRVDSAVEHSGTSQIVLIRPGKNDRND